MIWQETSSSSIHCPSSTTAYNHEPDVSKSHIQCPLNAMSKYRMVWSVGVMKWDSDLRFWMCVINISLGWRSCPPLTSCDSRDWHMLLPEVIQFSQNWHWSNFPFAGYPSWQIGCNSKPNGQKLAPSNLQYLERRYLVPRFHVSVISPPPQPIIIKQTCRSLISTYIQHCEQILHGVDCWHNEARQWHELLDVWDYWKCWEEVFSFASIMWLGWLLMLLPEATQSFQI